MKEIKLVYLKKVIEECDMALIHMAYLEIRSSRNMIIQ